ncbi:MAG: hypothetical protein JSR80_02550 [Verrucomicrobia bacterium]|nr:hypothetical protein [Verrucomicrobiota bacterium]
MDSIMCQKLDFAIASLEGLRNTTLEEEMKLVQPLHDLAMRHESFRRKGIDLRSYAMGWKEKRIKLLSDLRSLRYSEALPYISLSSAAQVDNLPKGSEEKLSDLIGIVFTHIGGIFATHHISKFLVPRIVRFI